MIKLKIDVAKLKFQRVSIFRLISNNSSRDSKTNFAQLNVRTACPNRGPSAREKSIAVIENIVWSHRGRHCFRHGSLATTLLQSNGREAWKRGRCISRNYPARYQTGQKLQFFAIYRWRRDSLVPVSVRVLSQDPRTKTPFPNRERERGRNSSQSRPRKVALHSVIYIYIYYVFRCWVIAFDF